MSWDAARFLQDYSIHYSEEAAGWLNLDCPFCEDTSQNGGINLDGAYYHCWRCGGSSLSRMIQFLLGVSDDVSEEIVESYDLGTMIRDMLNKRRRRGQGSTLELPGGDLSKFHRKYLEKRKFDPDFLIQKYGIKGSGPSFLWNKVDFSNRIMIPIYDRSKNLISFQGRTISPFEKKVRYKGCPIELSVQFHKETLYNIQNCIRDEIAVLEGVPDVWRMGDNFAATYGTSLLPSQVNLLRGFKRVFFLFDPEKEAQEKAWKYCQELSASGVEAVNLELDTNGRDPGELSESEATAIKKELFK